MSIFRKDGGSEVENVGVTDESSLIKAPVNQEMSNTDPVTKEANVSNQGVDAKDKVVMVDGPLSEIYTRALNVMFKQSYMESPEKNFDDIEEDRNVKKALESYVGMGQTLFEKIDQSSPVQGAYVYVATKEDMEKPHETTAISHRINANSKTADKGFLLIDLEGKRMMTERQAVLESYAESLGLSVHHNKESLLRGVHSWLSL